MYYNMALKVRERKTKMNEGLHYCKPQGQKIEHISQTRKNANYFVLVFLK